MNFGSHHLIIIAAVAENNVIGKQNTIPWHLPDDLKFFQKTTLGGTLVMGRRTFESLGGKPLPKRRNIVLSSRIDYCPHPKVEVFSSLKDALNHIQPEEKVFICGGSSVYQESLPLAQTMILTRVHAIIEGDTYFPQVDWDEWELISQEFHPADALHPYTFTFERYRRIIPSLEQSFTL